MESKTAYAKLKTKVSEELSKDGLKSRVSSDTIGKNWKKVKVVAGVVFTVSSLITAAPISIPTALTAWLGYITLVSGVVAGRAQLSKKK